MSESGFIKLWDFAEKVLSKSLKIYYSNLTANVKTLQVFETSVPIMRMLIKKQKLARYDLVRAFLFFAAIITK